MHRLFLHDKVETQTITKLESKGRKLNYLLNLVGGSCMKCISKFPLTLHKCISTYLGKGKNVGTSKGECDHQRADT